MIDLHLHTTASDGHLTPAALVQRAADRGITILSVTDHDTVAGLAEAAAAADRLGLRLVPGIEITAIEDAHDIHLLGYFFDAGNTALSDFLESQRAHRIRRVEAVVSRLRALGYAIDGEPLLASAAASQGKSLGRPQIADALIEAGHARDRNDAFERLLGTGRPAYVQRQGAPPEEVIDLIDSAGGIVSLAHPGLLRMDAIIPRLATAGLAALEARHSEHDAETERRYRELASQHGLAVSGGSDFHADDGHRTPTIGVVTLSPADFTTLESRVR